MHKKKFSGLKYPKLTVLVVCTILAYLLFASPRVRSGMQSLGELSYWGMFIAGMLFSFGFSTPFAVGFFVTIHPSNLFFASIIGGFGALLSDILIFKWIKFSFMDEFMQLKHTLAARRIKIFLHRHVHFRIGNYILYTLGGIIIASPIPDEFGVSMLAGLSSIKLSRFALISFFLNALGIFLMLLL